MWRRVVAEQRLLEEQTHLRLQAARATRIHDRANQFQERIAQRERWVKQRLAQASRSAEQAQSKKGKKSKKKRSKGRSLRAAVFNILDGLARTDRRPTLRIVNAQLSDKGLPGISTMQFRGLEQEWLEARE
jgi:hypothetical protein